MKKLCHSFITDTIRISIFVIAFLLTGCTNSHADDTEHDKRLQAREQRQQDDSTITKLSYRQESVLLEKYAPAIHIAYGSSRPVDLEAFYFAHSALKQGRKIIKQPPLNRDDIAPIAESVNYEQGTDEGYYVDYLGAHQILDATSPDEAPLYGRVYYEIFKSIPASALPPQKTIILKYNSVFTASGLPQKINRVQNILSSLAGDKTIWHELDIHGAIHLILDYETHKPLMVMLAQHNYFRSYVMGADVALPEDGHVEICFARRSNEPYLCQDNQQTAPTIGNPRHMEFVINGTDKPLIDGGYDIIDAKSEMKRMQPLIKRLPDNHPFYVATIPLGDIRRLFGIIPTWFRRGAPGADLYAPKDLKRFTDLAQFFYLQKGDTEIAPLIKESFHDWEAVDIAPPITHNGKFLFPKLRHLY